ncbi:MAG: alpha/beta hydrolase-fold protein [Candidatus Neomarinimicrobiota bacterium]
MITKILIYLPIIGVLSGQGTIIDDSFYSESLSVTLMVDVYLPEGYNSQDTTTRYPVIYYLHGFSGNQNSSGTLTKRLDAIIGSSTIDPVIVVSPAGGTTYWTNNIYGLYEDYVVYDLVTYIDSVYNTNISRDKRCISGCSMGGHGSMKLALKHPDIFKGVVAHSGILHFVGDPELVSSEVLVENGGSGPFSPDAGPFSDAMFFWATYFSPNPTNPPYFVDLPFDNDGNIIDSTNTKWLLNDPTFLATQLSPETNLAIYISCDMDESLFSDNQAFVDTLESLGIPYSFHVHNDGHCGNRDVDIKALIFLDSVMSSSNVNIFDEQADIPQANILHQNHINP